MLIGGQLRIAHQGEEVRYDWGTVDPSSIEWTAFYSDCEHEVLEVTQGHRVTLTYNLYVSEQQLGRAVGPVPSADPSRYPLYEKAKALLEDPCFMRDDGMSPKSIFFGLPDPWKLIFLPRGNVGILLRAPLRAHNGSAEQTTAICAQRP